MKLSGSATTSAPPRPASTMSSHAFSVDAARSSQTLDAWTAAARNVAPSLAMDRGLGVGEHVLQRLERGRRRRAVRRSRRRAGAEEVLARVVAIRVPDEPRVVDE